MDLSRAPFRVGRAVARPFVNQPRTRASHYWRPYEPCQPTSPAIKRRQARHRTRYRRERPSRTSSELPSTHIRASSPNMSGRIRRRQSRQHIIYRAMTRRWSHQVNEWQQLQVPSEICPVVIHRHLSTTSSASRTNERRVRRILLYAIDDVIRLSECDNVHRREPVSLKKLRQGDCSWSTVKQIRGWVSTRCR